MSMTHYMGLLADNQPWNLIIFMAIPVILAETIAITELYLLYTRATVGWPKSLNRYASIIAGIYFTGIFFYLLFTAVIPITAEGAWRGIGDIIAVGFYLSGVLPLGALALLELNVVRGDASAEEKLRIHAICVAVFLVVAHIAMIFGMANPELFGWVDHSRMTM